MKRNLLRILMFLFISMLVVSCVNYNRIRLVNCGKPSKREFVDQTQTEPKTTVASIDNGYYEIDKAEVDTIAVSDLNCDTIFLKSGKRILAQIVEVKRKKVVYVLCCEGCSVPREVKFDEIDTMHFAIKPSVVETADNHDVATLNGEEEREAVYFKDTIYFRSGKVQAVRIFKETKSIIKYYFSTSNGRISTAVVRKYTLNKIIIGDKSNSLISDYESIEKLDKGWSQSGRRMMAGFILLIIPIVGIISPIFFIAAFTASIKLVKRSVPITEAGILAKQSFTEALNFGKWMLLGLLLAGILATIVWIFAGPSIAIVVAIIAAIVPFYFYIRALLEMGKSAILARKDKLTRAEGDRSGDTLRRSAWVLITFASLFSVFFFPIIMLIAIINTMMVKKEDYKPAQ